MTTQFSFRRTRHSRFFQLVLITLLPLGALRAEEAIKGAFGQVLAATFDPATATRTINSDRYLEFQVPSPSGLPVLTEFSVSVTPLTYRVYAIRASGKAGSLKECVEKSAKPFFAVIAEKYDGTEHHAKMYELKNGQGFSLSQSDPDRRIDIGCDPDLGLLVNYEDAATREAADPEQHDLDRLQSAYNAAKYSQILPRVRELADHENLWALTMLGLMYRKGQGLDRDDEKGEEYYALAAKKGWPSAQYNLGTYYSHEFRYREAETLLLKAAGQSIDEADLNLGQLYLAKSPLYSEAKSFTWFLRGAEHGDKEAQYNTCYDYADGIGVTRDMVQAYRWCYIAAQNGQAAAARNRDHLAGQMLPADVAKGRAEAERWLAQKAGRK